MTLMTLMTLMTRQSCKTRLKKLNGQKSHFMGIIFCKLSNYVVSLHYKYK